MGIETGEQLLEIAGSEVAALMSALGTEELLELLSFMARHYQDKTRELLWSLNSQAVAHLVHHFEAAPSIKDVGELLAIHFASFSVPGVEAASLKDRD